MGDRRYRRRRDKDSFDEVADVARSAYRIASKIKDVINIETKSYILGQTAVAPDPLSSTGTFSYSAMTPVTLNVPAQGTEDFQRIGDSIKIHHLRFAFTVQKSDQVSDQQYRLIILWDEGNSVIAASDVLYSTLLGTTGALLSPKDWDKRFDSRVLYDRVFNQNSLTYNTTTAYGYDVQSHVVELPIKKHTQFEAGSTSIVTGALKFIFVSNHVTASTYTIVPMITYTDD